MPRSKGKKRDGQRRGEAGRAERASANGLVLPGDDSDHHTPDNMSIVSNCSDSTSIYDDAEPEEVDEISAQEDFEDKLKDCIDGLTQKSAKGRTDCLKSLKIALSKKFIPDFVYDRKMTIQDGLERCLKKGKGEEQTLAAICMCLLFIQLGATEDAEDLFKAIKPVLQTVMLDASVACKARGACAQTLGVLTFITSCELDLVRDVMKAIERVFMGSYLKGDGSTPAHTPEVASMHTSAIAAWSLLFSISPPSVINDYVTSHLGKMPELLTSADVDLRITAGETIALMYELARDEDEDFEGIDFEELCETLKKLATDSNKHRAKKDRRQQRSSFRDILRAVEEGDSPRLRIKVGLESVAINSWSRKKHYDTLCHVLGSGMPVHLQENDLVRDIFDLGPPIPVGALPSQKASRFERHMFNAAAFKARTKARSKFRDKRSVAAASAD